MRLCLCHIPVVLFYAIALCTLNAQCTNYGYSEKAQQFEKKGHWDSARFYYSKMLQAKPKPDVNKQIEIHSAIANTFYFESRYSQALLSYYDGLRLVGKNTNCELRLGLRLNIGRVKYAIGEKREAINDIIHLQNELVTCGQIALQAKAEYYLGVIYTEISHRGQKIADSALLHINQALKLSFRISDWNLLAKSYGVRGELHYTRFNDNGQTVRDYAKGIYYAQKSGDLNSSAFLNLKLGAYYSEHGLPDMAKPYLFKSRELFDSLKSLRDMVYIRQNIANYYRVKKNADSTYLVMRDLFAIYDTIFRHDISFELAHERTKFQTENKEKENAELKLKSASQELKIQKQKNQTQLLIIGVFIFILFFGGIAIQQLIKKRARKSIQMEELRKLQLESILNGQEIERQRISMDLHDGLGQLLSAAKMNIQAYQSSGGEAKPELLQNVPEIASLAIVEVRGISHSLMPALLLKYGIPAAVDELLEKLSDTGKYTTQAIWPNSPKRYSKECEIHIFRIFQEMLSNISRHSVATQISIEVKEMGNHWHVRIWENATELSGYNPGSKSGNGWLNIIHRVELLKGNWQIEKESDGTAVRFEFEMK